MAGVQIDIKGETGREDRKERLIIGEKDRKKRRRERGETDTE